MALIKDYRIRKPDVLFEPFDKEVILINLENGNYYSIQGVAAEIWSMVENELPTDGIIELILNRYQGVKKEVVQSVNSFLNELSRDGLIEESKHMQKKAENQVDKNVPAVKVSDLPVFAPPKLERYTDMQNLLLLDPIHDVGEKGWPNPPADESPQPKKVE